MKHKLKVIRYEVHPSFVYFRCEKCSFMFSFMRIEMYDILVKRSDLLVVNYKEQVRSVQSCPVIEADQNNYHDSVEWSLNGS